MEEPNNNRCLPYCKGTILKAIHNTAPERGVKWRGVYRIAKVRFWKQFTTVLTTKFFGLKVFTVLQRYDFESNSQPNAWSLWKRHGCLPYCKGTILKAIHNTLRTTHSLEQGVYRIAKVRFWKQFTTSLSCYHLWGRCLPYCKGTILEPNHNLLRI